MENVAGTIAVTVAAAILATVVALTGPARPRRFRVAEFIMIVGTLPWFYLLLAPGHPRPNPQHWGEPWRSHYLVPLSDLRDQVHNGLGYAAWQIGGNLLVFAAFGAGAPIRWRIRPVVVLLIAAAASTCVEITQYAMADKRVASVDDVLVNAFGAYLAALCARRWWRARRDRQDDAAERGSTLSSPAGTVSQR